MARQSTGQKKTVSRVLHEFKHGELESSRGGKVKSRRQAVAIALSEAGGSNQQSRRQNRRQYSRTKRKERSGQTAQQQKEGRRAMDRSSARRKTGSASRRTTSTASRRGSERTRAQLYREAQRRKVPGRSRMNKAQLQRALRK